MSQKEIEILQRALARERIARKQAEQILEKKSDELFSLSQKDKKNKEKLEALLKVKNSELKGFYENLVDPYIMMNLSGYAIKMNEAAEKLIGYRLSDGGFNLMKLTQPKDLDYVSESFKVLMDTGRISNFYINILTSTSEVKLVEVNASIIYDENNTPIAAQGILRDITLSKKYEKRLEAEKQKYSNIIANMNLGLLEVDNDDKILFANHSFLEMSGFSNKDLLGNKAADVFLKNEYKPKLAIESENRKKGDSNSYEIQVHTKTGDTRYWLISGAPNYNLNGEVSGSIGIHLDITNLKKLEQQKEELLKDLAKSNESLQEYAHIVSHDLKSPLRSINALVAWIKEDNIENLDEMSVQNLVLIEKTLEKMEDLISDVLEYSSVGANLNLNQNVDVHHLVKELVEIIYVPENIHISIEENLPIVMGDKVKLQQLFQNLLSNAIKFSDKEIGKIIVSCTEMTTHYQFSVSDNGMGIEKEYFDKIFKIFHSLNKRKDSSGIGLSIVKKIVELHHGNIWLESETGKGTTFYFTIKKEK
ncbi:PAS domain-containing sensor histidine kinase [Wenyingzhuangia fucanilytica]|uniref:histidine kinase n=1 Tax=Wenyingzhuangia fucanilytica TaxID=1790137 RepID=A0A1B1Y811_9FLAO|nr:PAS domain-containing sensor histidine kinase [Wenyingzhuangia fucanilytica]ANW96912.1 PAS domain-containing sensor histidine kinase [Wenyingzhuangia fucanilytica]